MAQQVIDASVAVKWVTTGEPFRHKALKLLRDARIKGIVLIGPPMLEYEVESILQRQLKSGLVSKASADVSLAAFYAIRMQIVSHPEMVKRAREIARQFDQSRIYDSLYAALAELCGSEFWTADKAFADAVRPTLKFVKYLPNYR
jgi:predicted nucleic acid-binding protein